MSDAEDTLYDLINIAGFPMPEREYRFAAMIAGGIGRGVQKRLRQVGLHDWRFDFAWPDRLLAIEIEGGTFIGGRHVNGVGFENDCRKYAVALIHGWRVLRVTTKMVEDGRALGYLNRLIDKRYVPEAI